MSLQQSNKPKKQISRMTRSRRRIRLAEIVVTIVCVTFCTTFGMKYVIKPFYNHNSQTTKYEITYNAIKNYVIEGDIYDSYGNLISGNANNGVRATSSYPDNYSYAWLLGYYTVASGRENSFGLKGNLKDYSLFTLDSNSKGATTYLTTNSSLQNYAFSLLNGQEGSITVIDNKTGAIRCLTSQSTVDYDVNDTSSLLSSTIENSQFRRGTFEKDPPGSTFKIITAAAALKKQKDENLDASFFQYTDTGSYIPEGTDFEIKNFGDKVYGEVNLEEALNNSVNTYFANLGVNVGKEDLYTMAKQFKIGDQIEIPFLSTLSSSFDSLNQIDNAKLAQTAFGQGDTCITPVHLTLIAQAVANNGVMMQPYIVRTIKQNHLYYYHFFEHKLNKCIDEDIAAQLQQMMHSTAVGYGLTEAQYGMVYAKTGTAECADGRIHTYIIGFTKDASFCISMNNGDLSSKLWSVAGKLVTKINECYQ